MIHNPYYEDSIIRPNCTHFRLRIAKNIVGYMQIDANDNTYYSKDNFLWRKDPIKFDFKDKSTEIFDANRVMIFDKDLVSIKKSKKDDYTKRGIITWDNIKNYWMINLIEESTIRPLNEFHQGHRLSNTLKVTGQLFS